MFGKALRFLGLLFLGLLVLLAGLTLLALEDQPTVAHATAPSPEDVQEARAFLRGVRAAIQPDAPAAPFETTESQLNSVMTLGARFVPGFRGRIEVTTAAVAGVVSVPVPYSREGKWLNLRARAPEFEGRFRLDHVEIGGMALPPGPTLELARLGANAVFGNRLGDTVLASATAMRVRDDTVAFNLAIDEIGQNGVMRGVFGRLRGAEMPGAAAIDRYYILLRQAMDDGTLPATGSYLPYLRFMLAAALDGSRDEGIDDAYTSAIFALTRVCGARDFTMVVGGLSGGSDLSQREWQTNCSELTLNGRIDSRRHFTTAAALQAASNRGFAVSVGEFKELYDSLHAEKGGFDFTDLAANASGIGMSNTLMAATGDDWPALLARIETERDVIVSFDGIPQIMTRKDFQRDYTDVDSAAYQAKLRDIEARVERLALNR